MTSLKVDDQLKSVKDLDGEIMVVDDESMVLDIVTAMISSLGYRVRPFDNPIDAEEYFSENSDKVSLVMMDMVMPEINGVELYKRLAKINNNIGYYILSGGAPGYENIDDKYFLGYIPKPVGMKDIKKKIDEGLAIFQ
ncbi:MAG: response regulator [Spirochaetales bacterium]|nr:response regulator [Spirochaetales bacterium]